MKSLSTKATSIKPSGIRKFFDLASTMEGVISLGVGEPDFATPWHICENAIHITIKHMILKMKLLSQLVVVKPLTYVCVPC